MSRVAVVLSSAWVLTDQCHWVGAVLRSVILLDPGAVILYFWEEGREHNDYTPWLLPLGSSGATASITCGERKKGS